MSSFESNSCTHLLTATEMRGIEQASMAEGCITGLELMERAGRAVVQAIFARWPAFAADGRHAVVLCGPGNNGGDGYVVARLLHDWGWQVDVFAMAAPGTAAPDAAANRTRWLEIGTIAPLEDATFDGADLIVDALFGIGLSRGFAPPTSVGAVFHSLFADGFWGHRTECAPYVVAVDVPSGLDADSGRVLAADGDWAGEMGAHLTVTFHAPKRGHMLADGPEVCGALVVADIGLPNTQQGVPLARLPDPMRAEPAVNKGVGHKYTHGHALVLCGPMGRSGAARLAARAALRVGAGLVTVAAPGSAMMECATQLTAIMLRKCDGAAGLQSILKDKRLNALCLGPGLGVGQGTRDLVAVVLADKTRGVVLDADALTSFADNPAALFALLHPKVVLTPHMGEFARLFPDIAATLQAPARAGPAYSKVDAARAAAARAGCVVLLKGPDTVISDPSGRCAISAAAYDRAAPWLATAGSGDVLAGLITGLLSRGLSPFQAAEAAAWLHVEAARAFGPGLIAEDLSEMLPELFRQLGL